MQKSLLQSQLSSLTSVKHLRSYKSLRHEELLLKIHAKKLLEELKQEIDMLTKHLPEPIIERKMEEETLIEEKPQHASLEDELDAIKAKLASLG